MLNNNQYKVLVTCCHEQGGLYVLDMSFNRYSYEKFLDGEDCRGLAKYGDRYIVTSNSSGVMVLDSKFEVLYKNDVRDRDYHAIQIIDDMAYIVETAFNAVGIYRISDLERVGEIKLNPKDYDANHINDIHIEGDSLFVSMFTQQGEWRRNPNTETGALLEVSRSTGDVLQVLYTGLNKPHNVVFYQGQLHYCNSMRFTVYREGEAIFQALGFTRGLAIDELLMFIGQSTSRHIKNSAKGMINISLDCGVYVFEPKTRVSRFVPLPSQEVYGILIEDVMYTNQIDFGTDQAAGYLIRGFYQSEEGPEGSWRWSQGSESKMVLYLDEAKPHHLYIHMDPLPHPTATQEVELLLNKTIVGKIVLDDPGAKTYVVSLPAELVRSRNDLVFRYAYATTPRELNGSHDDRELAVRFYSLKFESLT